MCNKTFKLCHDFTINSSTLILFINSYFKNKAIYTILEHCLYVKIFLLFHKFENSKIFTIIIENSQG